MGQSTTDIDISMKLAIGICLTAIGVLVSMANSNPNPGQSDGGRAVEECGCKPLGCDCCPTCCPDLYCNYQHGPKNVTKCEKEICHGVSVTFITVTQPFGNSLIIGNEAKGRASNQFHPK